MEEIAGWLYAEWGQNSPASTLAGTARKLMQRLQVDALPLALIALQDEIPVGTVSLKVREVAIRPEYEHWLGTLFVVPERRREGVDRMLVKAAMSEAVELGIGELYLYTRREDTRQLYERLGWIEIERPSVRGRTAIIMLSSLEDR